MDIALPYRAMAYNNGWANHRLLTACGRLSLKPISWRREPVSFQACALRSITS